MGHTSTRAALIYQHASHERDAMIADSLSEMVQKALGMPAQEDLGGDFRPNELRRPPPHSTDRLRGPTGAI